MTTKHAVQVKQPLTANPRFYILMASILLSLLIGSLVRLNVLGDRLFLIRLEQVYGYTSLIYWYGALLISPLCAILLKNKMLIGRLKHARRAIGVSAAYFALLHAAVAYFGQLGGPAGPQLPQLFIIALSLGLFSLIILGFMAATSFDKVIQVMTFRRWKWLHRLGYLAGAAVILHIWLIGSHATSPMVQAISLVSLAFLLLLEALRTARNIAAKFPSMSSKDIIYTTAGSIWLIGIGLLLLMPGLIDNYNQRYSPVKEGNNVKTDQLHNH